MKKNFLKMDGAGKKIDNIIDEDMVEPGVICKIILFNAVH